MGLRAGIAGCCVALASLGGMAGCAGVKLRRDVVVEPSAQAPSRQDLSHAATVAMDRHDFAQARADLELLLQQSPRSAELHFRLGKVLQFQDRPLEAEVEFKNALKFDPDYVGALVGLGQVDARLGRPQDALARFEKAIEVEPHHPEAHLARGRTLESLDRPVEALAAYFQALKFDPSLAEAMVRAAVLQLDRGQADQALVRLESADLLDPDKPEIRYRKGLTLLALARPKPAIKDLSFAAEHAPDRADILVGLARAFEADRQTDRARLALEQALRLQPELPIARDLSERLRR
jgi:tetratricopeptide (TPR) repeat protein